MIRRIHSLVPRSKTLFREMSELVNGMNTFLVYNSSLVSKMEVHGITSKHAKTITSATTKLQNYGQKNVSKSFASKEDMRIFEMVQDSNLSKLKTEFQTSQDLPNRQSELRYGIDKTTNLETKYAHKIPKRSYAERFERSRRHNQEILAVHVQACKNELQIIMYSSGYIILISAIWMSLWLSEKNRPDLNQPEDVQVGSTVPG